MSAESELVGAVTTVTRVFLAQRATDVNLCIQFVDQKNQLNVRKLVLAPVQITLSQLKMDFIDMAGLDHLTPQDIRLARVFHDQEEVVIEPDEKREFLRDFAVAVADGGTLLFEPTHDLPPPNRTQLTVISPDETKRITYEWCKATTTLKMLRDFAVEKFSLQDVDVNRIHLVTFISELPTTKCPDNLLIDWHVTTGTHVRVHVMGWATSIDSSADPMVRFECNFQDTTRKFEMPTRGTIDQLRKFIEERVQSKIFDLRLLSQSKGYIDTSDLNRSWDSFDIGTKDTIFVHFALKSAKNAVSKKSTPQPKVGPTDEKVTVLLKWLTFFQLQIPMFLSTKIYDLTKLEADFSDRRLLPMKIRTKDCNIDMKEIDRCLSDFGVKAGDIVYVDMTEVKSTRSSIVTNESATTNSKNKRIDPRFLVPLGLKNLGNTCYMNSAFQCLARVPPFTNFFIRHLRSAIENERNNPDAHWNPFDNIGTITGNYASLIWNLLRYNDENEGLLSIEAENMKQVVSDYDLRFNNCDQQDAQEFITFLLRAIHEEMKQSFGEKNTIIKELFYGHIKSTVTCTTCQHEESTNNPINIISLPLKVQERKFYITFFSRTGDKAQEFEVFAPIQGRILDVVWAFAEEMDDTQLFHFVLVAIDGQEVDFEKSLEEIPASEMTIFEQEKPHRYPVPNRDHELNDYKLYDCFSDFLSAESLENQWACPKENCGRKDLAKKQLKFVALPPVLVIHFKRFAHHNGVRMKVETYVDCPIEGLDLSALVPRSTGETRYDLVAVCNHMGYMFHGHYTATTRCETDGRVEWYTFDDASVARICARHHEEDIITRDAYLLFYVRRDLLRTSSERSTLC